MGSIIATTLLNSSLTATYVSTQLVIIKQFPVWRQASFFYLGFKGEKNTEKQEATVIVLKIPFKNKHF